MLADAKRIDSIFRHFLTSLNQSKKNLSLQTSEEPSQQLTEHLAKVHRATVEGVMDDLDLNKGLISVLEFIQIVKSMELNGIEKLLVRETIYEWFDSLGLDYDSLDSDKGDFVRNRILEKMITYREEIRQITMDEMKKSERKEHLKAILRVCDQIRNDAKSFGYTFQDGSK